ncbi:MAG: hypothetical protein ACOCZ8_04095 [Bacteroidota bacterium]
MGKTRKISLEEAKAQFEELLEKLLVGKSVSIAAEGEQPVELSIDQPVSENKRRGTAGKFRGKIKMPTDEEWAAMDREIEQDFEESEIFPE